MYGAHDDENIYDEWGHHTSNTVMVDFLLPTGIYIAMNVERNWTIEKIKKELWDEAIRYPLFGELTSAEMYVFMYVTCLGTTEEIISETKRLTEIDLLQEIPMLKLVKRQGDTEQKRIAQEIKSLAGIKSEKEVNRDPEKSHFRDKMRKKAAEEVRKREKMHWKELLHQHYPPSVEPDLNENTHFLREYGLVAVQYENIEKMSRTFKVNPKWSSADMTREALHVWETARLSLPTSNPEDYVLKGCGCEYLVGDYELHNYSIMRPALVKKVNSDDNAQLDAVQLQLLHVASVRPDLPRSFGFGTMQINDIPPVPSRRHNATPLWSNDSAYNVKVIRTGNINTKMENKKLVVHIGLILGTEILCNTRYTNNAQDGGGVEQKWDENLPFDILIRDLPRNAKLCIAICAIDKREAKKGPAKKKTTDKKPTDLRAHYTNATPLFWVNMNVFDYLGILKSGKHKLTCWLWPYNMDSDTLNPRGVVHVNQDEEAPYIEIGLIEHPTPLEYPSFQEVMAEAAKLARSNPEILQNPSKSHLAQLKEVIMKPPQDALYEEEKSLLWQFRMDCRDQYPEHLSKLLSAVKWNSYTHVVLMQSLLNSWRPIDPDYALELLDCQYADEQVRKYAIECLKKLKDDQLQQYLLQLVQVIKFEPYIDSPLISFLLERAWRNRKVGHYLFWHLKSELSNPFVSGRFTLILEAYLYGNISHIHCLHRQHDALQKMKSLNELVKSPEIKQSEVRNRGREALKQCMNQDSYSDALSNVECPLNPGINLEKAEVDPCKVMNSKMRPLWLVFRNNALPEGKVSVIYKNGDDLRQDMLTLQIISIMDSLWKAEGLDLRMIPYGCLSTGEKTGMIEVVKNSNTIANIQKEKAGRFMASFRHETLFEWIQSKNKTPQELEAAIQNFTYSCAGYCVATYVLGVGDRHSDNIMVTEKGQLFHIDFGHILGNFKTKYGIKRERVPFVLAHDFVHVINKGKTDTKEEFQRFRKLCDRAFLLLRRRGHLFITLFSLMLSSGLPELTSEEDLEHLRTSLALHVSEAQATKQFGSKFTKATKDAWATSVNWFFHNVAKNNT